MSFAQALTEDRRLCILRLLVEANGEAGESVLTRGLDLLGHGGTLTRGTMRDDLAFLEDRALIRLEWFADKVAIAHITRRGIEISEGKGSVEGVKRPSPGE